MAKGFSVPGMSNEQATQVRERLQQRLVALIDAELTLKHIHWNVVGPSFIGVHEMLDPQVDAVRGMVDELAERIATLGGSPIGTPGYVASQRTWDDYNILRGSTNEHLGALDVVYNGIIADHRAAIAETEEADPVTQDILIGQSGQLEQFQWFVRAHLEDSAGNLSTAGATGERQAADAAAQAVGDPAAKPARATKAAKAPRARKAG